MEEFPNQILLATLKSRGYGYSMKKNGFKMRFQKARIKQSKNGLSPIDHKGLNAGFWNRELPRLLKRFAIGNHNYINPPNFRLTAS